MTNERHEKALEAACGKHPMHVRPEILEEMFATYLEAMDAVIVPREPTEEMIGAGLRKFYGFGKPSNGICNAYREMVQAVPNHFTNGE